MNAISLKTIFARWVDAMDRRDLGNAYVVGAASLAPTAFGIGSLRVDVAAGTYVVASGAFAAFGGGNKTPGAAHATLPRVDLIYIDNAGVLQIAAGVAASPNPIPPALPAGALGIAMPFIAPGATDYTVLTASYIADIRQFNVIPLVPDGAVASPGLAFGNQTNSGLWRPGGAIVALSAGSVEVMRWDANTGVVSGNMSVSLGTNPSSDGLIRIPNGQAIRARNVGNTGNIQLIVAGTNDQVVIGANAGTDLQVGTGFIQIGTNPATAGAIRISSNTTISGRNNANSGNITIIRTDASDNIIIAESGQAVTISGNTTMSASTRLLTAASGTGQSGFALPHGSAPTSPINGDLWTTTSGLFARINGATQGPYSASGAAHIEAKSVTSDGTGLGTQTWTSAFGTTPAVVASPVSSQTDAGLNVASRSTSGATTRGDGTGDVHMTIAMENN